MRAPFARVGGKFILGKKIASRIPLDYNYYIEPFFGAGTVFFKLKKQGTEVINDIDTTVYTIINALKEDAEKFNNELRRHCNKENFDRAEGKTDACSLLERIKFSYGGNGKHFNQKCGNHNKEGRTRDIIHCDYNIYGPRLKDVIIYNKNFRDVIDEFNYEDSFFYLDPPYENSNTQHYKHFNVKVEDVLDAVKSIKGRFILSYNDSPKIRELFKDYTIEELVSTYMMNAKKGRQKKTELLIRNY